MLETDLVQSTYEDLVDIYGEDRVLVEPVVEGKTSIRPNLGVLEQSSDEFLVLIECSALTTQHREREDIKQIRALMQETSTPYGAIVSKSFRYVFEVVDLGDYKLENELPHFPTADSDERRALSSPEEIRFKFWRISEHFRGMARFELVNKLYYSLFRKIVSERHGEELDIKNLSEEDLERINELIQDNHPPFSAPSSRPEDVKFQQHVLSTFKGIDLDRTPPELAQVFVDLDGQEKRGYQSTPLWVSKALVDLTGVGAEHSVIDPAAGIGNVLRYASTKGAEAYAVEINKDAVNCGLFLNEIAETDITYTLGDYFELSRNERFSNSFPSEFDHGFIDPPFGRSHDLKGDSVDSIEEQFVLDTLKKLKPGGTLTAILPAGNLHKHRSTGFRETLLSEYQINAIIEIQSPIYERTSIPTAIIQLQNNAAPDDHEVLYAMVGSDEDPEEKLPEVVDKIRTGRASSISVNRFHERSISPREITHLEAARQDINSQYPNVTELKHVAENIRVGTRKPDDVYDSPGDDRLPYVNIRDLNEGEFKEHVSESDDIVVAEETDVLLSKSGAKIHVYHPSQKIAPSSMWAAIRFSSEPEALVYAHFLDSELARRQLEAIRTGTTILHIPIHGLREILVPEFTDNEITDKSQEIREKLNQISELQGEQAQLENELGDLFRG